MNWSVLRPTASGSCARGTSAGSIADEDGFAIVHDVWSRNAVTMTCSSLTVPASVRNASVAPTTSETTCVTTTTTRRSKRSEMTPPVTEKSSIGANAAKFRIPTARAEPVRSYTNTEPATFWSQVPMFENSPPDQYTVKAAWANRPKRDRTGDIVSTSRRSFNHSPHLEYTSRS